MSTQTATTTFKKSSSKWAVIYNGEVIGYAAHMPSSRQGVTRDWLALDVNGEASGWHLTRKGCANHLRLVAKGLAK